MMGQVQHAHSAAQERLRAPLYQNLQEFKGLGREVHFRVSPKHLAAFGVEGACTKANSHNGPPRKIC
jgi:hypothetical protein